MAEQQEVIVVTKQPDDPVCTRISIGGVADIGYYFTYRGDLNEAIRIVELTLAKAKEIVAAGATT